MSVYHADLANLEKGLLLFNHRKDGFASKYSAKLLPGCYNIPNYGWFFWLKGDAVNNVFLKHMKLPESRDKKIIVLLLAFCAVAGAVFADSVTLTTGKKISCKIVSENDDYLVIESKLVTLKLYRFEITNIEKGNIPANDTPLQPPVSEIDNYPAPAPEKENLKTAAPEKAPAGRAPGNITPGIILPAVNATAVQLHPEKPAGKAPGEALQQNVTAEAIIPSALSVNNTAAQKNSPPGAVAPAEIVPVSIAVKHSIPLIPLAAAIAVLVLLNFIIPVWLKGSALKARAQADYSRARGSQHIKQINHSLPAMNKKLTELKDEQKAAGSDESKLAKLRRDADTLEKLIAMTIAEKNKLNQVKVAYFVKALKRGSKAAGGKAVTGVNAYVLGIYPPWLEPPKWFKIMTDKYGGQ